MTTSGSNSAPSGAVPATNSAAATSTSAQTGNHAVHAHGRAGKTAIVLVNLGTPEAPTASAVRPYLKQFLSDPRVVEIPKLLWWFILNGVILPFRSRQSAAKYASIWTREGSPLKLYTLKQAALLHAQLTRRGHQVDVVPAMSYGHPGMTTVLAQLHNDGYERVAILPAYPQYSGTTTASVFDSAFRYYSTLRNIPELRLIKHYHDQDGYIQSLAQ